MTKHTDVEDVEDVEDVDEVDLLLCAGCDTPILMDKDGNVLDAYHSFILDAYICQGCMDDGDNP